MTKNKQSGKSAPNSSRVFDRTKVAKNRDRAAKNFCDHDFLFKEVAMRLGDNLRDINRTFNTIVDLGCHAGELSSHIPTSHNPLIIQQDLSQSMLELCGECRVQGDEEFLPYQPESLDLVISNLSLHWVNDLPGVFAQIRQSLKPDGLFLATLFGGDSLRELRASLMQAEINLKGGVSPHISPFVDIKDAGSLLQRAGFALPVVDRDTITVTYKNMFRLMKELNGMGEGNALSKRFRGLSSRAVMMEAARIYEEKFADERGRLKVTFDIITLMGWAPHKSQQKPLKPGSGKVNLGEVFGKKD